MLHMAPDLSKAQLVLCLGAHCDDIEIGCGGTLMTLAARHPELRFHWVTFTAEPEREPETRRAAEALLPAARTTLQFESFRGSYFPDQWGRIKEALERVKRAYDPALIFTHRQSDRHQDHRVISELTWTTFRNHLIFEYEIAKYEGDLGHPNLYVPLTKATAEKKISVLMHSFVSQHARTWFTPDTFQGLMRLRGIECNADEGLAESFHANKMVI